MIRRSVKAVAPCPVERSNAFPSHGAILKEPPVVLLDEATASLDPENEVEVQRAINTLIAGRTVIVIAHRLKTIKNADNIIVLEEGRIAEQGKHQELLNNKGLYAKLWNIQEKTLGWKL